MLFRLWCLALHSGLPGVSHWACVMSHTSSSASCSSKLPVSRVQLVCDSCHLVQEVVKVVEHPRPVGRDEAVVAVLQAFAGPTGQGALSRFFQQSAPGGRGGQGTDISGESSVRARLSVRLYVSSRRGGTWQAFRPHPLALGR